MRQDRASRTPHQSRATTERRPAAAEARQASSSRPARVEHRQSIVSCFPRSTRPPITSSTTPSHSRIRARARTRGNPIPRDSHRAQTRQADKRSEASRPSKDDAHGRPSRRHDQGDASRPRHKRIEPAAHPCRATRANDSPRQDSTPDATPEATRGRRSHARQASHQRQQPPTAERQEAAQGPEEPSQPA